MYIDLASPLSPIFVYPESFSPSLPAYFNKNPQLNLFLTDSLTLATLSSFNHDATIHCLRKTSSHPSVLKILCCLYFLYENSAMAPWSSCDGDLVHRYWCYWEEIGNWRRCGLIGLLCPWRYTLQVNVGTLSSCPLPLCLCFFLSLLLGCHAMSSQLCRVLCTGIFCLITGCWDLWCLSLSDCVDVTNHPSYTTCHISQELLLLRLFFPSTRHGK